MGVTQIPELDAVGALLDEVGGPPAPASSPLNGQMGAFFARVNWRNAEVAPSAAGEIDDSIPDFDDDDGALAAPAGPSLGAPMGEFFAGINWRNRAVAAKATGGGRQKPGTEFNTESLLGDFNW